MNRIRQAIKLAMTALLPRDRWIVQGPRSAKAVALTFDDGPHPEYTPRLLDELQRLDIQVTFFVLGQAMARNPEIVQRMVAEGHTVGTHSYLHTEPSQTSAEQLRSELHRSLDLCQEVLGFRPRFFRPPKGQLTWTKTRDLWAAKQTIVLWNQDPRDYRGAESLDEWQQHYEPTGGDIVLLHDIHPHCVAAIDTLAEQIRTNSDLKFATLDDWLPSPAHPQKQQELVLH